jgi:hypothetical protein
MGVSKATEDVAATGKYLPVLGIKLTNVSSQPIIVRIEIS